jgi:hypothetical protein
VRGQVVVLAVLVVVPGCANRGGISAPNASVLTSADVVGAAASAMDASGHFIMPAPHTTSLPEISAQRAQVLAVAYLGDYGGFYLPHFEAKHGGPIDLATTTLCGSPLYAATGLRGRVVGPSVSGGATPRRASLAGVVLCRVRRAGH